MDLSVTGVPCIIYENNTLARRGDQGNDLVLWGGEAALQLWVDKYDVRMLLGTLKEFEFLRGGEVSVQSDEDKVIEEETYLDLKKGVMVSVESASGTSAGEVSTGTGSSIGWDYMDTSSSPAAAKPFMKPQWLFIPEGVDVVPKTQMQYNVILHTVKRLTSCTSAAAASQLEILLRVKMSTENSKMAFMNKGDELHPFYCHIRSLDEATLWSLLLNKPPVEASNGTSLAQLLGDYGSGSSEGEEEDSTGEKTAGARECTEAGVEAPSGIVAAADPPAAIPQDPYAASTSDIATGHCVDADDMLQFDCDSGVKFYAPLPNGAININGCGDPLSIAADVGSGPSTAVETLREQRLRRARLLSGRFLLLAESTEMKSSSGSGKLLGNDEDDSSLVESTDRKRSLPQSFYSSDGATKRCYFGLTSTDTRDSLTAKITLALEGLYGIARN